MPPDQFSQYGWFCDLLTFQFESIRITIVASTCARVITYIENRLEYIWFYTDSMFRQFSALEPIRTQLTLIRVFMSDTRVVYSQANHAYTKNGHSHQHGDIFIIYIFGRSDSSITEKSVYFVVAGVAGDTPYIHAIMRRIVSPDTVVTLYGVF